MKYGIVRSSELGNDWRASTHLAQPGGPSERELHDEEPGPEGKCLVCGHKGRRYYLHKN